MPSTRVTVAANAKRSQKSPLIIPGTAEHDPSSPKSCQAWVYKTAQSKLRIKKPTRIFVAKSGKELLTGNDWKSNLKNDIVLLVSAGEDYIGAAKQTPSVEDDDNDSREIEDEDDLGEDVSTMSLTSIKPTINDLAESAFVDPLSITQLETTALTLKGIVHCVAQPDIHPGTKFPIGAVFLSKGWIHPPLIGGDIGCGMAWYKTTLSASQVEGDKGQRIAESLRGVEGPWHTQEERLHWLAASSPENDFSAGPEFDASLGTIGAGNHFAEIQIVENVASGAWQDSNPRGSGGMLQEGEVILLVHSGSRGYGGDILKRHTKDGAATSIRADTLKAQEYLAEHDRACAWADRNRDLIALRFLACLEPGSESWELGLNDNSTSSQSSIKDAYSAIQSRKVVEICHNNMARTHWPPRTPNSPDQAQDEVFIHRKGAAPISPFRSSLDAPSSDLLPLLSLPGSRGTPTLILHPTLTPENQYGVTNGLSLAHGAGRAMSRAKALQTIASKWQGRAEDILRGDGVRRDASGSKIKGHKKKDGRGASNGEEVEEQERLGRQVNGGTWVICEDKSLVWEEAPEAYKDVWDVGRDLVASGAAERVGWCRGRVSYKVRKE